MFSGGVFLTSECVEPEVVEPEPEPEPEVVEPELELETELETEVLSAGGAAEPEVLAESGAAPAVLPKTQVQAASAAQPTFTG